MVTCWLSLVTTGCLSPAPLRSRCLLTVLPRGCSYGHGKVYANLNLIAVQSFQVFTYLLVQRQQHKGLPCKMGEFLLYANITFPLPVFDHKTSVQSAS